MQIATEFGMHCVATAACLLGLVLAVVWLRSERTGEALLPRPTQGLPDTLTPLCLATFLYFLLAGPVTSWWTFGSLLGVTDETARLAEGIAYNALFAAGLFAAARHASGVDGTLVRRIAAGLLVGVVTFGVVHFIGVAMVATYKALGATPPSQEVAEAMRAAAGRDLVVRSVIAVVLAPFAEEVFFRGIMLPAMARFTGARAAVVLQAIAFGVFHFVGDRARMPLAIPLAVVGLATGWLYVRTRSLLAVILVHAVFNAIQSAFLLLS